MTKRDIISKDLIKKTKKRLRKLKDALKSLSDEVDMANEYKIHLSSYEQDDGFTIADNFYIEYWHCDTDTSVEYVSLEEMLDEELENWSDRNTYTYEVTSKIDDSDAELWDSKTRAQHERLRFLNILLMRAYDEWNEKFKNLSDEDMKTAKLEAVSK